MRYLILILILIGTAPALAQQQTVCLNMIVKNEAAIIDKCLTSVKPLIDYWVIVDTGSTDGTQETIKELLKEVPGELHERPWVDFAYNRNEALALAKRKGDYILIMDADDFLDYAPGYQLPPLTSNVYDLAINDRAITYDRPQLFKSDLDTKWVGILHEYLARPPSASRTKLDGVTYKRTSNGFRSKDPEKYVKDAAILENALAEDSSNARYAFYLAQSYACIPDKKKALEAYQKHSQMRDWDQETFWSLLQIGRLQEETGAPQEVFIDSYYKAYLMRPSRAEPLYSLANYYRRTNQYHAGYFWAKKGLEIAQSNDALFVEHWVYDYGLLMEYSLCAYWTGRHSEAREATLKLLKMDNLPANYRTCAEGNMKWMAGKK